MKTLNFVTILFAISKNLFGNAQFTHGVTPILSKPSITTLTIDCLDVYSIQRGENTGKFLIFIVPVGHHVAVKKIYSCLPGKKIKLKFKYELESIKLKGLSPLCHSKFKLNAYGCYALLDIKSETIKYVGQNINNGGAVLFSSPSSFNKFSNKFGSTIKFPSTKQQFKAVTYRYSWKIQEKVLVKKFGSFGGISKKLLSPIIVTSQISKFSFGQKNLIDQVWGFGYSGKPGLCDGKVSDGKSLSLCELYPVKYVKPVIKKPVFGQPVFKQPIFKQPIFKQPVFKQPVIDPIIPVDPLDITPPEKIIKDQIGPNTFVESATDDTFVEEIISPDISIPQADIIEEIALP